MILTVDGKETEAKLRKCGKALSLTIVAGNEQTVGVKLTNCTYLQNEDRKQALTRVISKFQMSTDYKGLLFGGFIKGEKELPKVQDDFRGPIEEILKMK